jgi:hypothetical protein
LLRKTIPIISVIILSILAGIYLFDTTTIDKELMAETFVFDAVYYETKETIEITFEDKSKKTSIVILEILGMKESFQKTFTDIEFIETIPFEGPPQYGWKTHPVTLVVEHEEFGKIGMKTEVHSENEPSKPIIFSSL